MPNSTINATVNGLNSTAGNAATLDLQVAGSTVASVTSTGMTATAFVPSGSSVPTNGEFLPAANTLAFATNSTERMRIDSSGNVGIGTNSPSQKLHVVGQMLGVRNALYNDTTTYGFSFQNATTTTKQLWGGYDSSVGAFIQSTNAGIAHTNLLLNPNGGNVLVGTTTNNASGGVLQVSNGITFPATQSASTDANTLDDYEEGTWTPSLGGNTTYGAQQGHYTKIGNVVFIRGTVSVTTLGTGSVRQISGLPFTSANLNGYEAAIAVSYFQSSATNMIFATIGVNCSTTTMDVIYTTAAAATMTYNGTFFGNSARIDFSGCYTV